MAFPERNINVTIGFVVFPTRTAPTVTLIILKKKLRFLIFLKILTLRLVFFVWENHRICRNVNFRIEKYDFFTSAACFAIGGHKVTWGEAHPPARNAAARATGVGKNQPLWGPGEALGALGALGPLLGCCVVG